MSVYVCIGVAGSNCEQGCCGAVAAFSCRCQTHVPTTTRVSAVQLHAFYIVLAVPTSHTSAYLPIQTGVATSSRLWGSASRDVAPISCLVLPAKEVRTPTAEAVARGVSSRCNILYVAKQVLSPSQIHGRAAGEAMGRHINHSGRVVLCAVWRLKLQLTLQAIR